MNLKLIYFLALDTTRESLVTLLIDRRPWSHYSLKQNQVVINRCNSQKSVGQVFVQMSMSWYQWYPISGSSLDVWCWTWEKTLSLTKPCNFRSQNYFEIKNVSCSGNISVSWAGLNFKYPSSIFDIWQIHNLKLTHFLYIKFNEIWFGSFVC